MYLYYALQKPPSVIVRYKLYPLEDTYFEREFRVTYTRTLIQHAPGGTLDWSLGNLNRVHPDDVDQVQALYEFWDTVYENYLRSR